MKTKLLSALRRSRLLILPVLTVFIFLCGSASISAQVKQVEMHIAGYLCGN